MRRRARGHCGLWVLCALVITAIVACMWIGVWVTIDAMTPAN